MIIYPNLDEMKEKLWEIFMRKYDAVIANPNTNQFEKIFCNISVFPERHLKIKIKHSNGSKKIYTKEDELEEKLKRVSDVNVKSFDQAHETEHLRKSFDSREKKKFHAYPTVENIKKSQSSKPQKTWVPKQEKIGFLEFDTNVVALPGNGALIADVLGKLLITDDDFPNDDVDSELRRLRKLENSIIGKVNLFGSEHKGEEINHSKTVDTQTDAVVLSPSPIQLVEVQADANMITQEMFDKKRKIFLKLFQQKMRDLQIAVLHGNEVLDFEVETYSQCLSKIMDLSMLCSRVNAKRVELRMEPELKDTG